jgi:hypothetical protein
MEYNESKAGYLQFKRSLENFETNSIMNDLQIIELTAKMAELKFKDFEETNRLKLAVINSLKKLDEQLKFWAEKYLLMSPIDGEVSLSNYWNDNQFVPVNSEVFTIIPEKVNTIIGRSLVPVMGSGKNNGKPSVQVFLDNYPNEEFGILRGEVKSISKYLKMIIT